MTVTTRGTENVVEQITKQINKLIDVIKVSDLTEGSHHEIEYVLLKLFSKQFNQTFKRKLKNLEFQVIEQDNSIVVLGITGSSASVDSFLKALNNKSFVEISRSGCMGMHKSEKHLTI
jgi:acetolactate synthase-1/3 small subunit